MVAMRVLDLFCGAGGSSEGLRQSGIDVVLGIDIWPQAVESYCANGFQGVIGDIRSVIPMFDVDILVASPECRQYSTANTKKKEIDYSQILAVLDIIKLRRPKYWVIENVIPMLKYIKHLLPDGSYIKKLDCADYGVPQYRRRLFISNFEINLESKPHISVRDILPSVKSFSNPHFPEKNGPTFYPVDRPINTLTSSRKGGLYVSESLELSEPEYYMKENVQRWMKSHPRLELDRPSYTITAHAGRDKRTLIHPTEWRRLTVDECSLLQGFPPDYAFIGSLSSRYTQIGNAVPPPIMREIGLAIQRFESRS